MKKSITSLLTLAIILGMSCMVFAQNAPIDFESGGYGAGWTWTVFENGDNPALEVVTNPDASGANTSATVAKFTARTAGAAWAGCESLHGSDIGTFNLDATNSTIKIMVYKPVISDVGIKLVKPDGWSLGEIKVANTVVNAWEELTFDMSSRVAEGYDQIVVFPDFDLAGRTSENVCYFDNITFSPSVSGDTGPTVAAPVPTHAAENVFSIYSDAYTDLENTNFNPNWGQSTVQTFVTVDGNNTIKYDALNYQGTNLGSTDGGVPQDVSGYDYFHVDFWTPNATALNFFLLDQSAGEISYPLPITTGEWVSVDIPLSYFSNGGENLADIHQFKVDGGNGVDTKVWFDNWYFYKGGSTTPTEPTVAAPTPTIDAANVISLFSNAYTNVTVDTWSADWDAADVADVQVAGDDVKLYTNMTFAGIEFTSQTIDASNMTRFHMDIWTPDSTALPKVFKIKLVDFGADGAWSGGDDVEHELAIDANSGLTTGNWVSIDLALADFTNLTTKGHLAQLIISADPNTVYVDNVYLYAEEAEPVPTIAAPTPTLDAADVISLFSNAYTNVTVDTWSAGWDAADVADVQVAGDDVKLYTNMTFAGIEFTSQTIDASNMNHFHMDIWTPDSTALPNVFKIKLVDFGADGAWSGGDDVEHELAIDANSGLTTGNWVSIDLALADFTNLTTKEHLAQLILSGDLKTVYVDNVYFYTTGTAIRQVDGVRPVEFTLQQNYPNPFNPTTNIRFTVTKTGPVHLKIYNLAGQEVTTLLNESLAPGVYEVNFDASNMASGTYFYQLVSGGKSIYKKMLLTK